MDEIDDLHNNQKTTTTMNRLPENQNTNAAEAKKLLNRVQFRGGEGGCGSIYTQKLCKV